MLTFILILIAWAVTIVTLLIGAWICYFLLTNKSQKTAVTNVTPAKPIAAPVVNPPVAQSAVINSNQATTTQ